jgi:hypothetical protein
MVNFDVLKGNGIWRLRQPIVLLVMGFGWIGFMTMTFDLDVGINDKQWSSVQEADVPPEAQEEYKL